MFFYEAVEKNGWFKVVKETEAHTPILFKVYISFFFLNRLYINIMKVSKTLFHKEMLTALKKTCLQTSHQDFYKDAMSKHTVDLLSIAVVAKTPAKEGQKRGLLRLLRPVRADQSEQTGLFERTGAFRQIADVDCMRKILFCNTEASKHFQYTAK